MNGRIHLLRRAPAFVVALITVLPAFVGIAVAGAPRAVAAGTTFTVNSNGDAGDAHVGDGICQTAGVGICTLRAALQEANVASTAVTIAFNIPGPGVHTIAPASQLPLLTNTNGITIDGFTQPGSSPNSDPLVDNAVYGIDLKGTGPNGFPGIYITGPNNTVRGMVIRAFSIDVYLYQTGATNNTVVGNMLGLQPDGTFDPTRTLKPGSDCVVIQQGASSNFIGLPGNANRNVISGCNHQGVATYNWPTKNNLIRNNIIGLDPTGTQRRGNESHGVDINTGTQYTTIGGTGFQEANVLSGNFQEGVEVSHNPLTTHNTIIGNLIGTDPTGNAANANTQNGQWGVHLEGYANCNNAACPLDAGFQTVTNNIIVNSGQGGVLVDKGVHDSVIANNKIGVLANGAAAGNHLFGVNIQAGSVRNTVGPGNEIAFNDAGVQIKATGDEPPNPAPSVTNQNKITQNSIHDNGVNGVPALGIDLTPFGSVNNAGNADPNVNDAMLAPSLSNATASSITATTCAGCTVELFIADRGAGAFGSGKTLLSTAVADGSGVATLSVPANANGKVVTATSTNSGGSTSEFSRNASIPGSPRTLQIGWTASEASRLQQVATYLGTTPVQLEHDAVFFLAFLTPAGSANQPSSVPPMGSATIIPVTFAANELQTLDDMAAHFVLSDVDTVRLGVYFIEFLVGLGGH